MIPSEALLRGLLLLLSVKDAFMAPPLDDNVAPRPKEGATKTNFCESYHHDTPCNNKYVDTNTKCIHGIGIETCPLPEEDKSIHCFVLWRHDGNNTGVPMVKGCFLDTVSCHERVSPCRLHNAKIPLISCCCEGNMCNENATFPGWEAGIIPTEATPERKPVSPLPSPEDDTTTIIV